MRFSEVSRYKWLDLCRGIFMCMVYLYHGEVFYGNGHSYSWIFEPIFLSGFFFISGYLFTADWEKVSLRSKWLQTLRGIIIPYILFMSAFVLPKILLLRYDWHQTVTDILLFRASWFVIAIGVIQLLYGATFHVSRNTYTVAAFSIIYTILGLLFANLYCNLPDWFIENSILHSSAMPGCMPFCVNLAFFSCPYFALGLYYRKYESKVGIRSSHRVAFILFALYACRMYINRLFLHANITFASCSISKPIIIYMLFVLAIACVIALSQKKQYLTPFNYIGRNTLLFYYLNVLMLRIGGAIYDKTLSIMGIGVTKDYYINIILVSMFAVLLTIPVVWFINNYLPVLTGKKQVYQKITENLELNIKW